MSIDTFEQSEQDAAPIELYEFTAGVNVLRFTSWHRDYLYQGATTFTTASIRRSAIEDSPELSRAPLDLTVARDFPIAELFRVAPPSYVVRLSVFRIHAGDTERALIWSGRVIDRTVEGSIAATLHCEPVMTGIKRLGLTRSYQRACPHALYSEGPGRCNVSRAAFSVSANLSSVAGVFVNSFTFALQPDGYYAGGDLEWDAGSGRIEYRGIRSHVGTEIELTHPIADLAALDTVVVAAGCSHEITVCDSKFGNSANYGGFPNVPQKNPYGGGSVF
jgi:uncharacterized phage protein (TIGR02218 family)